jgi:hypothetical protein
MSEFLQSISGIARLIKRRGPLKPLGRGLAIWNSLFSLGSEWKYGLSAATQHVDIEYREGLLRIVRDPQETVRVER